MNVPPTTPATANSILAQYRARPTKEFRGTANVHHYTIPPMSMIFATGDSKDMINDVSASADCFSGLNAAQMRRKFKGVSIEGIWGAEATRFRDADRITAITRGEATIMVPYKDVERINLGSWVRIKTPDPTVTFANFDKTPTYTIEQCDECFEAIGRLIRKPSRRHKDNFATVLLD